MRSGSKERDLSGISVKPLSVTTHRKLVPELGEPNLADQQVDREMTGNFHSTGYQPYSLRRVSRIRWKSSYKQWRPSAFRLRALLQTSAASYDGGARRSGGSHDSQKKEEVEGARGLSGGG